ncbi:MAG: DUF89 family protein [Chloroflexi bacterium]|nr:DUF89 family protein [Chloroflexota bacterium]
MKATKECYPCLERLVRQAATLATEDVCLRVEATDQSLKLLAEEFSTEKTTIVVATRLHRLVRALTSNPDPYIGIKEAEVGIAGRFHTGAAHLNSLRDCISWAVRGNSMDFFKDVRTLQDDLEQPVAFARDDTPKLEAKLKNARRLLYLADNAGEVFFDLPLVRKLSELASVTYVVKQSPVQNDITLADLETFGLLDKLPKVITTGTDTPGVDMPQASAEFKEAFADAELVLAKGMGYWETLSELPAEGRVFYLLKAKCQPVADSLGVALSSYVALLR